MKKILAVCFLAVATSTASANSINVTCSTSGGSGASGTSTSTCPTVAPPVGFTSLDDIILTFKLGADFSPTAGGSVEENFVVLPSGSDAFGGELNHPADQLVTDSANNIIGTLTIVNPTLSEVDAALGGLMIQSGWDSGSGSFEDTVFNYQIAVVYTQGPGTPPIPEPGTFALLGTGLLGLGSVVRRRFAPKI